MSDKNSQVQLMLIFIVALSQCASQRPFMYAAYVLVKFKCI